MQSITSYGHLVVVGMAQWSDGHSKLAPLLNAVANQAGAHDQG